MLHYATTFKWDFPSLKITQNPLSEIQPYAVWLFSAMFQAKLVGRKQAFIPEDRTICWRKHVCF